MKIGFIGLGIMGKPMALNLLSAGYEVVVVERKQAAIQELISAGATVAASPKIVAQSVDLVLTMLPNSPDVTAVVLGEDGVIEGSREGLLFVDMSSIDPMVARELAEKLESKGVVMLDAPVSGGEPMAISASLSFMVGGPEESFAQVLPVLSKMGKSVVRVGEIGAGNIAKLANQAIVAVNIAVVAEALVLAKKAGVDPEAVYQAIKGGLAGSNAMNAKVPLMLEHKFDPGFRVNLHVKDLNNVMAASLAVDSPMPLTATSFELLKQLKARGFGESDHSSLLLAYEAASAVEL